jgi:hypothetical protein
LKTGGEEICHSIVFARHGLASARGPKRPADDHVVEEDQLGGAEQNEKQDQRVQSPNWAA